MSLLMPAWSPARAPRLLAVPLRRACGALLPTPEEPAFRDFGCPLKSRSFSARGFSASELLRDLQMVAASEPTSWLSWNPHILTIHSADDWGPRSAVWAVPLSTAELIPRRLTCAVHLPGIRSSDDLGNPVGHLGQPVALPPGGNGAQLALKLFRREPAITGFDWSFAPILRSSKNFSTFTGRALRPALPGVRPAQG